MTDQHADLRRAFTGLVAEHSPAPVQVEVARERLRREIAGEGAQPPARSPWRIRLAAATAVLAVLVVATTILPWGRSSADANLLEIAEATRVVPAIELPAGSYLYTESNGVVLGGSTLPPGSSLDEIAYLIPQRLQSWIQGDNQLLRETLGEPVFFDPAAEEAFYDSGLDLLEPIGEAVETAVEGYQPPADPAQWSTNIEVLVDQFIAEAELAQNALPLEQRIVNVAFPLLLPETQATPVLRAAVIEAIALFDVTTTKLDNGHVLLAIQYQDEYFGSVAETWTVDRNGYLVAVRLVTMDGSVDGAIPGGTAVNQISWLPPEVVDEAGLVPGDG